MRNSKQYIYIPRTILITLIVISLAHILLASEDKDDENSTNQQNYGRKTRRLMRPFSKSDTSSDHAVSKGLLPFAYLRLIEYHVFAVITDICMFLNCIRLKILRRTNEE